MTERKIQKEWIMGITFIYFEGTHTCTHHGTCHICEDRGQLREGCFPLSAMWDLGTGLWFWGFISSAFTKWNHFTDSGIIILSWKRMGRSCNIQRKLANGDEDEKQVWGQYGRLQHLYEVFGGLAPLWSLFFWWLVIQLSLHKHLSTKEYFAYLP